jgi:3-oxoacyl-[acyl-carrier protein] reductase
MSRTALVTGASGGLGSAIARALADDGFTVVGTSRRGGRWPVSDAAEPASIEALVQALGPLSLVVAAAGISPDALLVRTSTGELARTLAVNAGGVLALARACAPSLAGGAFVAVGSLYARGAPANAAYAASKGALAAGVTALARVERAIRFVTVVPGYIPTAMAALLPEAQRQALTTRCPLRRAGRPEEVAQAVLFAANNPLLASGSVLHVAGGLQEAP